LPLLKFQPSYKDDHLPLSGKWVVVQGAVELPPSTRVHCMAITQL